jgi:hypothetical protein
MSTGRSWQDIKAEAHRRHPELADPDRQAKVRAELDAYVAGHHLTPQAELTASRAVTSSERPLRSV